MDSREAGNFCHELSWLVAVVYGWVEKKQRFNITVIHEKGTDPKTRWTAGCGARCPISGEKIMSVVQKFFLPVSKSTMYSTRRMLVGPGKVASYSISNLDIL
jgi:hypothetical protein